ncbi:DUF421 domain-containing protein [Methanoculleus horonobensis]|uniref:hypothetical protein n=1 Tax=Methanoculleus horonobensis TaxID=528314 RepID=UPI00082B0F41|nr:hypothetical protein [Methanoculleus horonobensis]
MSELFVLQTPVVELILRATVIYFFLLLVMRLIGRHEFGQLTPFDLILLLIISESTAEAFTAGDGSLLAARRRFSPSRCSSPSGSTGAGGFAASSRRGRSRTAA